MRSIKQRISLFTGLAIMLAIAVVTIMSISSSTQLLESASQRSEELLLEMFEADIHAELDAAAGSVEEELHLNFALVEGMATVFQRLKVQSTQLGELTPLLRDMLNDQLQSTLKTHPDLLGIYTLWEPDALDGRDAEFADSNKPGYDKTGRFIPYWSQTSSGEMVLDPLMDYEDTSRPEGGDRVGEYYLCPRDTKAHCLINPYTYEVNGQSMLITSLVAPIVINNQFVGITGVDITLTQLSEVATSLSQQFYNGQSHVVLVTNNGTIAANSQEQGLGKDITTLLPGQADLKGLIRNAQFQLSEIENGELLRAIIPVHPAKGLKPWVLYVSVPRAVVLKKMLALDKQLDSDLQTQTIQQVIVGLAVMALGCLLIWLVAGRISRPLQVISGFMLQVAGGDFTRRLDREVSARDETGELARACNQFLDKTQGVIQEVVSTSHSLSASAQDSTVTATQALSGVKRQQNEVSQLAAASNEMSATAQEVANHALEAANATNHTRQATVAGQKTLTDVCQAIEGLETEVKDAAQVITRLENNSQRITSIVEVIREIADQTNLLALNAAIEAARAGEHGRGFAVVADEVRSLSLRTQSSTQEIYTMIGQLQADALEAVDVMERSSNSAIECVARARSADGELDEIAEAVNRISDLNTQVASAAEQQSAVAEDINSNLSTISTVADEVAQGASRASDNSRSLQDTASALGQKVSHFTV